MAINDHFVSTQSRNNVKFRELLSLYKEFTSIQRVETIFCLPVWIWIWMIITNLQWKSQLTFTKEFECWNIRSQDYSFHGTFVPMMELSFSGPFVPWNIRSLDHSFPGTFRSRDRSFPGPFVPETEYYAENSFP